MQHPQSNHPGFTHAHPFFPLQYEAPVRKLQARPWVTAFLRLSPPGGRILGMMAATSALPLGVRAGGKARPLCGLARGRRRWMSLPATATDRELVAYIRRGGSEAVALLVERYSARLYRYLLHLASDPALADDLLQDTWLRVVERLDGYDARQPFLAWLFAIARHRAIDLARARARETRALGRPAAAGENEEGERLEPLDTVAAQSPSPLEQRAERDLEERVARLFGRLPLHYREVLTLRFHHDLSLEEIARLLGLPLSTVKTRVQRGLVLLRQRAESFGLPAGRQG